MLRDKKLVPLSSYGFLFGRWGKLTPAFSVFLIGPQHVVLCVLATDMLSEGVCQILFGVGFFDFDLPSCYLFLKPVGILRRVLLCSILSFVILR